MEPNKNAVETVEGKNEQFLKVLAKLEVLLDRILEALKPEPLIESQPDAEPDTQPAAEPVTQVVMALVHGIRYPDELAICGALGTKAQPFAGKPGERVARDLIEINCPSCRKIIEAKREKNGNS